MNEQAIAIIDSFYRILKRELVRNFHYGNPAQARKDILNQIYSIRDMAETL